MLSVLAGVVAVMAAAYLVTGHVKVSCLSDFHRADHTTGEDIKQSCLFNPLTPYRNATIISDQMWSLKQGRR